jgi:hypothetical protein
MEIPRKYHHAVPITPHTTQVSFAYSEELNSLAKAMREIGMSAIQRMVTSTPAGPSSNAWFEKRMRSEAIANNEACRTGAAIRALGNLNTQ